MLHLKQFWNKIDWKWLIPKLFTSQSFTSPRLSKKLENYPNLKLEEISSFLTFRENVTLKILRMFLKTPSGTKPYNSFLWQEVKNDKQLVERPPRRFVYHYIEYNQKIWKTEKVEKSSKCQMGEKISSREHMSDSDTYTPRNLYCLSRPAHWAIPKHILPSRKSKLTR